MRRGEVKLNDNNDNYPEHIYAYNYDIAGNVKDLYIYSDELKDFSGSNGWKKLHYEYDLISGKVKALYYQQNQPDQWLHRFLYDILNRLVSVKTSRDGWYWEEDAHYFYYLHRPLMRTELGQRQVQGLDFTYTLNGWMKTLNNWKNDSTRDAGQDGKIPVYQYVARDVLAYQLNYFQKDYKSIDWFSPQLFSNFTALYNGNMAMSIMHQDTMKILARRYRYDALNRLQIAETLHENVGNFFSILSFRENFEYDKDGNILKLNRWAAGGVMDSLTYKYYNGNNRLRQVKDVVSATSYANDIDDQTDTLNYVYDKEGHLIKDKSENLKIHWTYYGKLKQIDSASTTKLKFYYDALGNRIRKENVSNNTEEIYVRDAQGNIIAVYEIKKSGSVDSLFTKEYVIWGDVRLGYMQDKTYIGRKIHSKAIGGAIGITPPAISIPNPFALPGTTTITPIYFGKKHYELTDWLGNVRVVVSDKKVPVNNSTTTIGYKPIISSVTDYYSFGSEIFERPLKILTFEKVFLFNSLF